MPSRLTNDVLFDILELAFYSPTKPTKNDTRVPTCPKFRHIGAGDRPGLKSTSLVCKQWLPFSQSILFRRVELKGKAQVLAFAAALRAEIFLGDAVQALKIELEEADANDARDSDDEDLELSDEVAMILSSCRRLYELRLSFINLRSFSPATAEHLRQNAPPVTMLDIYNKSRSKCSHWRVVGQLLEYLPSVEYLFISGDTAATPCKYIKPRFRLSSLMWDNWTPAEQGAIETLLRESVGKLQSLSIRFAPDMRTFRTLMLDQGPYLKSLSLWHAPASEMHPIASAISQQPESTTTLSPLLSSLESFQIISVPTEEVLDALPPTLKYLHFASSYLAPPPSLSSVFDWVPKQKNLKKVSYRFNGDTRQPDVRRLETICREKKIELELLKW